MLHFRKFAFASTAGAVFYLAFGIPFLLGRFVKKRKKPAKAAIGSRCGCWSWCGRGARSLVRRRISRAVIDRGAKFIEDQIYGTGNPKGAVPFSTGARSKKVRLSINVDTNMLLLRAAYVTTRPSARLSRTLAAAPVRWQRVSTTRSGTRTTCLTCHSLQQVALHGGHERSGVVSSWHTAWMVATG